MKIASKISFAFLITAVFLTGICAPLFYMIARKSLEERIYAHLETTAQSRAHHIETYLNEHKEKVEIMADSALAEAALEKFKNKESSSTELTKEASLEVTEFIQTEVDFYEIFVLNLDGKIVNSTDESNIGLDRSTDAYFLGTKERVYIKDAYYSTTTNRRSIAISAPVLDDETRECLGVLVARLDLTGLDEIACDRTGLGETGEIYIVNKEGYMITPSRFKEDTFLKLKVDTENTRAYLEDVKKFGSKPHRHVPFTYIDYRGVKVLGMHDHIPQMTWGLLAKIDAKEVLAPLAKIKFLFVFITIFVPIAAWLIGIFFSGIISKPIRKLQVGAEIIGLGNLDYKVEVDTKDEIGQLSQAFDQMSEDLKESHLKLRESHKELEKMVQERTVELSSTNKKLQEEIEEHSLAQRILTERIKELGCLYGLSKIMEKQKISLEQIFRETVVLVHGAYRYPDLTCVRVTFEGIQYKTDNFKKSELSQYAEINVRGEKAGEIEVYYLGGKTEDGQSPFIEEERALLDAVAERLGRTAERKKAAEKLHLFQNLLNRSSDSIFVMEPEWGRFLDVNNRTSESLGYTREELLNMAVKDIDELIVDDSSWKEHVRRVREAGSMVLEGRHKRKDGTTFPVEVNVKFIDQDKKSYMVAIARDVTERKQAEQKLKQAAEEWITTFNSITDLVSIQDRDFKFIRVNKAFADTLKMKPEEFVGKTCYEIIHGTKEPPAACPHKQTLDTKKPQRAEFFEPHLGIYLEACTSPIFDENRDIVGSVHIAKDITQRKKVEESQAGLLEEVESTNRELKDFAYIISHDLKAPLRGIKTLANWISTDYKDKLDDAGKEQIDLLSQRVDRMHNLIDGVLQYSRVGRIKQAKIKLNLNELVPEVIDMVAPPENIEITIENELPVIECEQNRVIQVFQNLLSNAVKYMDKPQGRIRIGCVEEDGFWKFSIADNGPGIEERHFERIFRIFQTLSSSDEYENTGVGLTVVKKIVELYGGSIFVRSEVGKGSTFFFTLPRQEVKDIYAELETNIVS